jgi:hypothetical protein
MHHKTITTLVAIGALATASAAGAQVANTFGWGGTPPTLSPSCTHGAFDLTGLPTRKAMASGFTITQTTLKCEHLRVNRIIGCAKRFAVTEAPADRQGFHDESGAAAFVACVAGVTGAQTR